MWGVMCCVGVSYNVCGVMYWVRCVGCVLWGMMCDVRCVVGCVVCYMGYDALLEEAS